MKEIGDFFNDFFDTDSFPPRWYCGRWSEFHGWLYIVSDIAIWAAYFTIPFLLIHFIRRKKDIPFPRIFWLFGTFIFACGATHLIDAIIFWVPVYRLSAFVRLITAIVSWGTIFALYKILPHAFSLKTPAELEKQVQDRTEQLNISFEKMRFMADVMPQMVWTAKPDGYRDYYNNWALSFTGRSMEQMTGWRWAEILHPEDREYSLKRWKESINNGTPFEIENRQLAADGKYYWHLSRAHAHTDENGNVIMWVGTATEIEQHKRAAELLEKKVAERTEELNRVNIELAQSNTDLEQFAAIASHDLQAPLRTINSYLGIIRDRNQNVLDERSLGQIEKAIKAAARMKNLIQSLLEYSRINTAKVVFREFDLNNTVDEMLSNIEDLKQQKNAQIIVGQMPVVYADELQINQLLQNLVTNGINYNTSDPVIINIDALENEDEFIITVRDNGMGIEEEYKTKIFEVFTRLNSEVKGSGLGLSISKKIVDKHHGRIWIESVIGKGTTFYFTIPKIKNISGSP
jgi:PAS domain S-box-containing protein